MRLRMSSREVVIRELFRAINMMLITERGKLCFDRLPCNYLILNKAVAGEYLSEKPTGPTVADIFRRAQAIRSESAQASYKELAAQLVREYSGSPFPPTY